MGAPTVNHKWSFISYVRKISQKSNISEPLIHRYVYVSGNKKCQSFGKFCLRMKWMIPNRFMAIYTTYFSISNKLILSHSVHERVHEYIENRKYMTIPYKIKYSYNQLFLSNHIHEWVLQQWIWILNKTRVWLKIKYEIMKLWKIYVWQINTYLCQVILTLLITIYRNIIYLIFLPVCKAYSGII